MAQSVLPDSRLASAGIASSDAAKRLALARMPDAELRRRIEAYLSSATNFPVHVSSLRRLPVGLSWTTVIFTADLPPGHAAAGELVLKLGPVLGLMAPYSSLPQALAATSFAGTTVPVPAVRWYDDDDSHLGGPFLISDRAEGEALNPFVRGYEAPNILHLPPLGEQFAQILADIHRCEWSELPIAKINQLAGNVDRPAIRELHFWRQRAQRWSLRPMPVLELAGTWLEANMPHNPHPCVVHGDYRVGNFLCTGTHITAMLDWEMVHVGDHHEDLAWAFMPEFRLNGLVSHGDFLKRYATQGGLPVSAESLRYYTVFCLYKLAVINLGAAWGFEQGSDDLRLACLGLTVSGYLDRLGQSLAKLIEDCHAS